MAISPRILSRRINFSVVRVSIFLMLLMGLSFFLKEALISTFKNNLILNSLILGTFSVGIILSLRNLYSLRCGARWIESAQKEEKGDLAQSSHAGFPPVWFSPLQPLVEPSLSTGSHTLIGGRATAALEKVAQHIGQAREFPRYLIGLLIFLGLLGTFWGLSQTIRSVAGVISTLSIQGADQAAGFEALKNGLREPLTGMGTAFSCSMFGLAGSLILGFVELQVGRAAGYVISHIDEWISFLHNRPDRMAAAIANDPDYLLKVLEFVTPQVGGLGSSGILDSVKEVAPLFTLRG